MQLMKIEDNRDGLDRMSRDELWNLAVKHGVQHRFPNGRDTPHSDYTSMRLPNMVEILRALGIRAPDLSHRILGHPIDWHNQPAVEPPKTNLPQPTQKSEELRENPPLVPSKPKRAANPMLLRRIELVKECKAKGVRYDPKDKIADLEGRLRAASGEQAAS